MSTPLIAALIAGSVSLLVSVITAASAGRLQEAKMRAEAQNAKDVQEATLHAQEARLRTELRTEFMAEEAIRGLLTHEHWTLRSFEEIKRRLRGFDDDELRQLLVRAGAVAFERQRGSDEMWGLRERNVERL